MSPILHFDIIENIIDSLVDNDSNGLQYVKDFSLVSQAYLPLCRKHLFSSISVKITTSLYNLHSSEAFGKLLQEKPVLAKYVRDLKISISNSGSESEYFLEQVSQLTRLRSLSVSHSLVPHKMYWYNISSSMRRSLLILMHLPTLTHLDMRWISNFPTSDLIACSNIKDLSAHEFYVINDRSASSSYQPMQLQVFNTVIKTPRALRLLEATCSDGQPILDFSGLEKISVDFEWVAGAVPFIRDIFRKAQRLKDISFRIDAHDSYFRDLAFANTIAESLQTLKRVKLTISLDQEVRDPLAGFCDDLQEMSGRNVLECIEIDIEVWGFKYEAGDEWHQLEEILLKPGWPSLKRVSIGIIFYSRYNRAFETALESLPRTQFSGLRTKKDLDFQLSIRSDPTGWC